MSTLIQTGLLSWGLVHSLLPVARQAYCTVGERQYVSSLVVTDGWLFFSIGLSSSHSTFPTALWGGALNITD
eukprot:527761-Pyramimonas_sp.AAC.1